MGKLNGISWWFLVWILAWFHSSIAKSEETIPYARFAKRAIEHRKQFGIETITNHFYVIVKREHYNVLNFVVASCSRQRNLERSRLSISDTNGHYILCYLDLSSQLWTYRDWLKVIKEYPYSIGKVPLVIRGDWLINQLTDTVENDGYYLLLYGKKPTKKEFLTAWGIDLNKKSEIFGFIEGDSQISVNKKRLIESLPVLRGNYAFSTKDSLMRDNTEDPLENLLNQNFKHDGEEWIIGHSKFIPSNGSWVNLQYYALFNGQGKLVNKADTDLVEDYSRYKGLSAVRTPGSCINCHVEGLNIPTKNDFRSYIIAGAKVYGKKDVVDFIDLFYGSNLGKEIKRSNEDYNGAIEYIYGTAAKRHNQLFKQTISEYQADLTLDNAAKELYTSSDELRAAIGYQKQTTATIAKLAHGEKITRKQFRSNWKILYVFMKQWAAANE